MYPLVCNLAVVQEALSGVDTGVENKEDGHEDESSSTFEFYVNLVCKRVKQSLVATDETYSSIRISRDIRKFCSDVVMQLIARVSPLIKLYTTTSKVKTVSYSVVDFVFKFLLMDSGGCPTEFTEFIEERLRLFRELKNGDDE